MRLHALAFVLFTALPAALLAQEAQDEHQICLPQAHCRVASGAELDGLRGGFDVEGPGGPLRLGIGIYRTVSINDRVVAVSSLTVQDVGQAIAGRPGGISVSVEGAELARSTEVAGSADLKVNGMPLGPHPVVIDARGIVVQNGPGNVAPDLSRFNPGALPTIVQNTLDNQKLRTSTVIDVSANSLSMMRSLRMGDMLGQATARSGR
jgi:hypothetical protein